VRGVDLCDNRAGSKVVGESQRVGNGKSGGGPLSNEKAQLKEYRYCTRREHGRHQIKSVADIADGQIGKCFTQEHVKG